MSNGQSADQTTFNNAFVSKTSTGQAMTGDLTINDTTQSTDKDTGALIVEGGVGIEKNLNVGGNAVITGNLTVSGTTAAINTTNLEVTDKNVVVNKGGTDATSEGAGITVERTGTDGSIIYAAASQTKFKIGAAGSEVDVVDASTAQTLTNKQIDADLNTITNIDNADIKAAAAIARSKLANGTADYVVINNGSGVMSEEQYLSKTRGGAGTDISSITFPSTGTLATLAGTETLSNKTFSDAVTIQEIATPSTPAAGFQKIYPKADGKWYGLDDTGTETELGSAGAPAALVACSYTTNAGQSISNTAAVHKYEDLVFDTDSAYDTGTGVYTCPSSGKYFVRASTAMVDSSNTAGDTASIFIYHNGTIHTNHFSVYEATRTEGHYVQVSDLLSCSASDTIAIYTRSTVTTTASTSTTLNRFIIFKVG